MLQHTLRRRFSCQASRVCCCAGQTAKHPKKCTRGCIRKRDQNLPMLVFLTVFVVVLPSIPRLLLLQSISLTLRCPFTEFSTYSIRLELDSDSPFGVSFEPCPRFKRAYVTVFRWLARRGLPVPVADVAKIAERLQNSPHTASFDGRRSPSHLRLHDLRRVCAPQSVTGEAMTSFSLTLVFLQMVRLYCAKTIRLTLP
jgi:hypothetical protein